MHEPEIMEKLAEALKETVYCLQRLPTKKGDFNYDPRGEFRRACIAQGEKALELYNTRWRPRKGGQ